LSDSSQQPTTVTGQVSQPDPLEPKPSKSMQEYHTLQKELLIATLACTGIIFISVWIFYNLNIALNYLIGACTGVVYLRMLAKNVEQLGREKQSLSKTRFALFIGLIIVATQWRQLEIVPIFLGFLAYKAALIIYTVQTAMLSDRK